MTCPKIILRYGAHAEKEYFLKLCGHFDAFHINANLFEISKAATTSLVATTRTKHPALGFYLNPVTYLFGPYISRREGTVQRGLEWIKSFSKRANARVIKESYASLASELGSIFTQSVNGGQAIDFLSLSGAEREQLCAGVLEYQKARLAQVLGEDDLDEFRTIVDDASILPLAIFAPYFYVADEWRMDGIAANAALAKTAVELEKNVPVHQLALMSPETLHDRAAIDALVDGVIESGVSGIWLWVSRFNELVESEVALRRMRALVSTLSAHVEVNMYAGGLWSMLLGPDGLSGVAHGVGYGEGRDVISPIGAAAPTVRYYFPPLAKRISVASIERSFPAMRIADASSFHEHVCDCTICRGVLNRELGRFSLFGEMHTTSVGSRESQTPAAAKLCRYHFLIRRLEGDRKFVSQLEAAARIKALRDRAGGWASQPTLASESGHIDKWCDSFVNNTETLDGAYA